MEILLILTNWILFSVIVALIWLYYQKEHDHLYERENMRDELLKVLDQAKDERNNLYDRIMAGTLTQYKELEVTPDVPEEEETTVDLDEAKEELMNE